MILLVYREMKFVEDRLEGGVAISEQLLVEESVIVVVTSKDHTL